MKGGYFKAYRSTWDDGDFDGDEFSRREAWFWLIGSAAWKPRRVTVGGTSISLERGQCAFSLRYLAKAWGWSVKRVRTFLKMGTESAKLRIETGTRHTLITICNYEKYQGDETTEGTTGAQSGHDKGTNNKKERKEEGKDTPPSPRKPKPYPLPDDWTLPDDWLSYPLERGWTESEARDEADSFRDHFLHIKPARSTEQGWRARWQRWVRNNYARRGQGRPDHAPGRSRDPVLAALERYSEAGDGGGLDGSGDGDAGLPETDLGSGGGGSETAQGVVIDLFKTGGGGVDQGASWSHGDVGGTAGPCRDHGRGVRGEAVGISADSRGRGGSRLDGTGRVFPAFVVGAED